MPQRNDAGLADVELALAVEKHVLESGSIDTVGTVGILELHPRAINSIPSKAHMEIDLHSSDFEMEVSEKQEIAKLGYDIPVIYELVNLEVKIYASELYTGASRTAASCRSFTTARSAGCSAPASCSSSSKWTKFKPFGSLPSVSSTSSHGATVLSGNRNFEGRVHPLTRANYLASLPLVVAYALVGTVDIDFENEPTGPQRTERMPTLETFGQAPKKSQLCGSNPFEGCFLGCFFQCN
ncbi:hypothetical protein Lser_V15G36020 [Lactuca serriola]